MKSVMHEASSIAKAIEAAWDKAGKPTEFTIKVLEEPKKNFFGFTTRSAKVAIYFDFHPSRNERQPRSQGQQRARQPQKPQKPRGETRGEPRAEQREAVEPRQRPERSKLQPQQQQSEGQDSRRSQQPPQQRERQPRERDMKPQWTEPMIETTRAWLSETLSGMNIDNVKFSVEPSSFYLRVAFQGDILPDPEKEKKLFSSFATLILETLKRSFKVNLRGHKIVLVHATAYDLQQKQHHDS